MRSLNARIKKYYKHCIIVIFNVSMFLLAVYPIFIDGASHSIVIVGILIVITSVFLSVSSIYMGHRLGLLSKKNCLQDEFLSELVGFNRNIVRMLNKIISQLYSKKNEYNEAVVALDAVVALSDDVKKAQIENLKKSFANGTVSDYNRFLENVLEQLKGVLDLWLQTKGISSLKVSIAVKQFNVTVYDLDGRTDTVIVKTIFRDRHTWQKGDREIRDSVYKIMKNSAFTYCL
ncbi:MAG: hypothetical protein FWC70_06375 [Defluviitaleaceae bacterium]|nr:hypothetical protein [Defluviitaleaceae bacterium]